MSITVYKVQSFKIKALIARYCVYLKERTQPKGRLNLLCADSIKLTFEFRIKILVFHN